MAKGDERKIRVVIHREGKYATAFWARWEPGSSGRGEIYYGRGHSEIKGEYLRASYHGSGEQRVHHPEGVDRPTAEVSLRDFAGLRHCWTTVLRPDLSDLTWKTAREADTPECSVLLLEASNLPSWPLGCINFWIVEHGRDDLVQEAVSRRTSREYALMAETQPQMVAFLTGPTAVEIEGIQFAMAHPPSTW